MDAFKEISGLLAPMPEANIDTDVIMPKQFLKGIDRQGLDKGVFYDLRFTPDGQSNPNFILNKAGWQGANFLVVGANFGCGSSREHAVWGLKQLGIQAIIGTSFAGIFDDNCQRNGVITLSLGEQQIARLLSLAASPETNHITISLEHNQIVVGGEVFTFTLSALKREMLMGGEDAIGWTLQYLNDIERFETEHFAQNPWLTRPLSVRA